MTDITLEERALYIGERLLTRYLEALIISAESKEAAISNFSDWLSSPDGLHAVKRAMIEKGYEFRLRATSPNKWECGLWKNGNLKGMARNKGSCSTEAEAILSASYMALKSEE